MIAPPKAPLRRMARARTAPIDQPPLVPLAGSPQGAAQTVRRDVCIQLSLVLLGGLAFTIGMLPVGKRYGATSKLIGGASSLAAVCYVVWCYSMRRWRRYPNKLLVWRAVATGISSATILVTAALELSFHPRDLAGKYCPSIAASFNPLLVQFGFLAHEGWALVMALDVFLLMRDPFTDNTNMQRTYHVLVWGGSALFTCWLAWGTRMCAWGLGPAVTYGVTWMQNPNATPPALRPGYASSGRILPSSLPLLRREAAFDQLLRIEARYCLHSWGGVPPERELKAAELLHTSCAYNQSDTSQFVCTALAAARSHAEVTGAPWQETIRGGLCRSNSASRSTASLLRVIGGNGSTLVAGTIATNAPWRERLCMATATAFKAIHTLPVECWERSGTWNVEEDEGGIDGRVKAPRVSLSDGAWALTAFAWAPLFGLISLVMIVALGCTMNGASTRAMRAREAAIARNVDSVFHNQFLYWLPLYYVICQLGSLNVADCKWLVRACRPLATWRWYDEAHSTAEANWIGAMQVEEGVDRYRAEVAGWCMVEVSILSNAWCCTRVMVMISTQGLWLMMFFSSLHRSGLYSPSLSRAIFGRSDPPVYNQPANYCAAPWANCRGTVSTTGGQTTQMGRRVRDTPSRRAARAAAGDGLVAMLEKAACDDADPRGNIALRDEVLYCIRRGVSDILSIKMAKLPPEGCELRIHLEAAPQEGPKDTSCWWDKLDGRSTVTKASSSNFFARGNNFGDAARRMDSRSLARVPMGFSLLNSPEDGSTSANVALKRSRRSLHSVLKVVEVLCLGWLLFARQVSGPRGTAATWPLLAQRLFSCTATQCATESSRKAPSGPTLKSQLVENEAGHTWGEALAQAVEVAAWVWDKTREDHPHHLQAVDAAADTASAATPTSATMHVFLNESVPTPGPRPNVSSFRAVVDDGPRGALDGVLNKSNKVGHASSNAAGHNKYTQEASAGARDGSTAFGEWAYLTMKDDGVADDSVIEMAVLNEAEPPKEHDAAATAGSGVSSGEAGTSVSSSGPKGAWAGPSSWAAPTWESFSQGDKTFVNTVASEPTSSPQLQRAQALWQAAMTVATLVSGARDVYANEQRKQDALDLNSEWHDPCVWVAAVLPLLLVFSLALALTSFHQTAIWHVFARPHVSLSIGAEAAALAVVGGYGLRVQQVVSPIDGRAPRCALSGADGVLLDFLLVVAIFLVLLPPAVARICGAEWRLPCGCAATRGKPAELSPQLHESSQRSHTTANGTQLSLLSSPSALDVKDSLQAHQLHAARKGFGKSADVVASRSTDILSSISSVKSMVSNRVLGGRSVTFDAIEPRVFARMRFAAGFSKRELLASIQTIDDAGGGLKGGASGAFLFPSQDGRIVVKTLNAEEAASLRALAPAFAAHFSHNPNSLINRFLGQFKMFLYGRTIHFVIIQSVFSAAPPRSILTVKYDLKGSWVNRSAKPGDATLKDNDLRRDGFHSAFGWHEDLPIRLPASLHSALMETLETDSAFLSELNVMDYSLLLCAFEPEAIALSATSTKGEQNSLEDEGGHLATLPVIADASETGLGTRHVTLIEREAGVMLVGVIDVLQAWTCQKAGERCLKTRLQRRDARGVSAMPVAEYRARFLGFAREIFSPLEKETRGELIDPPNKTNDASRNHLLIAPLSYILTMGSSMSRGVRTFLGNASSPS